ncbi:hypothetical protein N7532_000864 [Penicillium argentinense]|uniref:Uncharacterized protein n=1 Tax=Penicillium argentinense TaxID=1131581 RepID=A0A9W9G6E6_9EURO|nr:uncharacterized protein N7532_000864 [Penicillium argentinense]KAJ5112819.1 hypothetical protein N7532_000864 [Penicillium argentinense]
MAPGPFLCLELGSTSVSNRGQADDRSRLSDEALKAEIRKACDVAIDHGLDLEQIGEDKDPNYFKARGVDWGIARRCVRDIRY